MGALTPRDRGLVLDELIGLLPPGWATPKDTDSRLANILGVSAEELARIEGSVRALMEESDPRTTVALFDEWERAFGLPDDCTPNWKFTRPSKATWFDGAGVLREAAIDEPRYVLDGNGQPTSVVFVEGAAINGNKNVRHTGAAPGIPGTSPTTWSGGGFFGQQIVAVGTEDGIPYVDWRCVGTSGTGTYWWLIPVPIGTGSDVAAAVGEKWTGSAYMRLVGGTWSGVSSGPRFQVEFFDASNAGAGGTTTSANLLPQPTNAPLRTQRFSLTATATGATTAKVRMSIAANLSAGTYDMTFRLGGVQLEKGDKPTSLILTPVGSPAISTRAADNLVVASLAERRARLLQRIAGNTGQSRAFFTALATALGYGITITEYQPARFGQPFGLPMNGEDWAHAWSVAAAVPGARKLRFGDRFGLPFQTQEPNALDCCFRALSPAHSTLLINAL